VSRYPAQPSVLDAPSPRAVAALLAFATLVAAGLRLPFLGSASLWFDETYTVSVIGAGSPGKLWDRIGATESTPPLFYALTWLWAQLAGDGEAAVRTVSAVALIAAVPVGYAALRRLVGWRAALATAAIVAVAPVLVEYALDARAYGLLVLASLLSVWAFAALLERDTLRARALWALAAAATIWTHWFGGFLVLAEVVVLLWLSPRAWRATVVSSGVVLAALLPLLPLLRAQTGDERAGFIADEGIRSRLEQMVRQFAMGENVATTWLEAAGLALAVGGVALGALLALRAALDRRAPASDGARALLGLALVGLVVPLALAVSGLYDRFNVRNVLFLLPLAAALAALGLVRLRTLPLAAYLALCVATAVWSQADWRYRQSDWRAAIEHVLATDPRAPVIASTATGQPVAAHYLRRAATPAPLATRQAWLVVEPVRGPGRRGLAPVAPVPAEAPLAAAFPARHERTIHGFRVIELTAPAPVTVDPAQLPGSTVYPAAVR
jgi:4-amino-4-deoxy-L-arabinose transferase-like glycosyltransferase